ncbi:MAG: alpha/beta hydrolase [Bacillota bacterium]|nr:alpha/beta hydrolase [Bacillota bacterium]
MLCKNFIFKSDDGTDIFVYNWTPDNDVKVKGIVQIAHGMAETAARYERFAETLTGSGYIVYANDHRGHGRTAGSVEKLGYLADNNGFDWLVKDLHQLSVITKKENPSLPLFLLGHSMGSFAAQRYIMLYGDELNGAVLSGSNGKQGMILNLGLLLAKNEIKKHGRKAQSHKLSRMTFGSYNNAFKPNRTEFDWLSRDNHEVDKYIKDQFCGTVFTAGFFYDFLTGLKEIEDKKNLSLIPKKLPIYIFSGEKDPVGKFGKGVIRLLNTYKSYGIKDITYKLYKDGRHEMLNETNRYEVMKDIIHWLNLHNHNA